MIVNIIHIGKCGGSTVGLILTQNNIKFEHIHIEKPIFNKHKKYLIMIRNPIRRFISAFNWRYRLVVVDKVQPDRFKGEAETLTRYKSVENMVMNIDSYDKTKQYIHHIYEDIDFYLGDFLQKCKKKNIVGVILQEDLNNCMMEIFRVQVGDTNLKKNNSSDTYISNTGYEKLKKYLYKDYQCIDKLYSMGLITERQYKILSE